MRCQGQRPVAQLEHEGSSYDRQLIDVALPLASGERLPTKTFIYVGREDRFGKAFARGPLYETVNERGEPTAAFDPVPIRGCEGPFTLGGMLEGRIPIRFARPGFLEFGTTI